MIGFIPVQISAGNVISVPPPETELTAPPMNAAKKITQRRPEAQAHAS